MAGRNRPKRAKVRGNPTKALFKRKILNGGFRLDVATTPLKTKNEIKLFFDTIGGNPFLANLGLSSMSENKLDFTTFDSVMLSESGPFWSHLEGVFRLVKTTPGAVRQAKLLFWGGRTR